jgi:hypothetical protein
VWSITRIQPDNHIELVNSETAGSDLLASKNSPVVRNSGEWWPGIVVGRTLGNLTGDCDCDWGL